MKFYGQFIPSVDEFIYERYFKNKKVKKGFFVECGAFDGLTECSCKFFEESLGWEGINVEPSPMVFKKLQENRPNTTNVNIALSNVGGEGVFHAVIHPTFGEQCTNGSLQHTEKHLQSLKEMKVTFKEYKVNILTWKELIKKYKIKNVTLFVLDVEGNELKVIEGMHGCRVLPDIFVVEHGNLDKQEVIRAVEELGYKYDTSNYVNSFFVRDTRWKRLVNSVKSLFNVEKKEDNREFFEWAEQMQYVRAGKLTKEMFSEYEVDDESFVFLATECQDNIVTIYSIQGIEGESCDSQIVYYQLEDPEGNEYTFETCQQIRDDYAEVRQSDLYRKSGARISIIKDYFNADDYVVRVFLKGNKKVKFLQSWKINMKKGMLEE